jgi:hypothetical protein
MFMGLMYRVFRLQALLTVLLAAIFVLALLFGVPARAGDINAAATKAPAYTLPTYPTLNGLILSLYTEGGGSSVTASAPGVPSASLTTTTAAIGVTAGYMFTPKSSPFTYSAEADVCASNYNGNNAGFSVQGPLCFEARFMVWAPWQQIISAISAVIPIPNPFSSVSAFPIMTNGVSPVGATLAGLGGGIYGKDISTAFQGVQAGKVFRVDPEIVAMLVQPLSNGGAIREFVKTDFNSQSQIIGSVPKGQTLATLGNIGVRAGVGYAF